MKMPLLFTSLCCLSILYIHHLWLNVLLIGFYIFFYMRHFSHSRIWFMASLCYVLSSAMLIEVPSIPKTSVILITELHDNYCIGEAEGQKVMLFNVKDANFGDIIDVEGTYEAIDGLHNEGEFYFPAWASRKGIAFSMHVKSSKLIQEGTSLHHLLYEHINHMDDALSSWLKMTLFGMRDNDEIMYLAASSGMHVQFLLTVCTAIAQLFLSNTAIAMLNITLLSLFGLTTTFSFTIMRILCTKLIRFLFPQLSDKESLGMLIFVIIFFIPSAIYEIGFILPIAFRFVYLFHIHKIKRFTISVLLLIPIQFYFYQYVDVMQILLFPFFRLFYGICFIFAWLILLIPWFQELLSIILQLQEQLAVFSDSFPKLYYLPNMIWLIFWGIQACTYLETGNRKTLYKLGLLFLYTQCAPYVNPFLKVTMLDIGQGDCTLIELPYHQGAMLLDIAGNRHKNIPEDVIVPMLLKRGIDRLDVAVITHDDFDHSGGLSQLQELMEVDTVIDEKQQEISLNYLRFDSPLYDHSYDTENDNSILLSLQVYDYHMLFMGDCGVACEEDLLKEYPKLKADILKIGHHGSRHSSSPAFIHQLDPLIALISCGRNNRYKHPDEEVLHTLEAEEVYPLITAKQGSCTLYFSNFISFYKTADGEFGIIKHR